MNQDFESLPIGTGAELARLSDLNRELADALAGLLTTALKVDDLTWADAVDRAGTNRPCDVADRALEKAGL